MQDEVIELPHVQPTAEVPIARSNVKEVVLAGGVEWSGIARRPQSTCALM